MAGIDSFEFLGLGYHVEWPINIILTPAALKIYADIFSFHVKVKLAVFSLTKVWSSLKVMIYPLIRYVKGLADKQICVRTRKDFGCNVGDIKQQALNFLTLMHTEGAILDACRTDKGVNGNTRNFILNML